MITRMHHVTLAALLTSGVLGCATATPPSSTTAHESAGVQSQPRVIEGQVVRTETNLYVIREYSGRQTRIPLDGNTVKEDIAVGDTVVARFDGPPSSAMATSVRRSSGEAAPRLINTPPLSRTVDGIVQQLESNYVVIKESTGRDVRLHVDNTTRLDQSIRIGDRVVAMTNEMPSNGAYVTNMYRLNSPPMIAGDGRNPRLVQGELMQTDGNWFVIKDGSGANLRLQVDNTTTLSRNLKIGDQVVATNVMPADGAYATDVYSIEKRGNETMIQGEVVRIDESGYVVRDVTGKEVRLQADSASIRNENVRVGERVIAYAGPATSVHADSIAKR